MKRSIKNRWVKALRSGDYEQGTGMLKNYDRFCCLGVLTDLYLKEIGKSWNYSQDYLPGGGVLPDEVREWSGVTSCSGLYQNSKGNKNSLTNLNDATKMSFKQIANIIDKIWERL